MREISAGLEALVQVLSPAYQRHAIQSQAEQLLALINVPAACETARQLLDLVGTIVVAEASLASDPH